MPKLASTNVNDDAIMHLKEKKKTDSFFRFEKNDYSKDLE